MSKWQTQLKDRAGSPPAAFDSDNVEVTGSGFAKLELRNAGDNYSFPDAEVNCIDNCIYSNFTTGVIRSLGTVGPGTFVEVLASPPSLL